MQVIRHGNTYRETRCKKCEAILSYCRADIKRDSYDKNYHIESKRGTYEEFITCPECSAKIILKQSLSGKEQIYEKLKKESNL